MSMTEHTVAATSRLGGSYPFVGHMVEFARNPVALMQRVRAECGPVGEFRMLNKNVVLLSGLEAQEAFCRAPDEQLSQTIAYRMMTPVFGEGVVFDAPPARLNEQLRILMPALRDRNMRTYAGIFVDEVDGMVRHWAEQGTIDLLAFTAELTTYTSSHCLLGAEFRHSMNAEFARVYGALEQGVNEMTPEQGRELGDIGDRGRRRRRSCRRGGVARGVTGRRTALQGFWTCVTWEGAARDFHDFIIAN